MGSIRHILRSKGVYIFKSYCSPFLHTNVASTQTLRPLASSHRSPDSAALDKLAHVLQVFTSCRAYIERHCGSPAQVGNQHSTRQRSSHPKP